MFCIRVVNCWIFDGFWYFFFIFVIVMVYFSLIKWRKRVWCNKCQLIVVDILYGKVGSNLRRWVWHASTMLNLLLTAILSIEIFYVIYILQFATISCSHIHEEKTYFKGYFLWLMKTILLLISRSIIKKLVILKNIYVL